MAVKSGQLSGWGRYPTLPAHCARPERYAEFVAWSQQAALARGAGRAYGDAAISAAGTTVLTSRINRLLAFDPSTGLLRAEPGVTLDDILSALLPRGWFFDITPGTRFITLGGAIAADVHGKNHPKAGSFARCVEGFWLYHPTGECYCSRVSHPDLFAATLGGMGMTGMIGEVTLRLRPITSSEMWVTSHKVENLAALLQQFEVDSPDDYAVAWIDVLAKGVQRGRGVFSTAHHALDAPLTALAAPTLRLPVQLPSAWLNTCSVRQFNRLYYAWTGRHQRPYRQALGAFFYPLDGIADWHRLYGRPGFVQYQFVVPQPAAFAAIDEVLATVQRQGLASFLAVVKRLGDSSEGWLSFPMPGITLALDLPRRASTPALLQALDAIVVAHQGRVYLAKDAGSSARYMAEMYPNLAAWQSLRQRIDPDGLLVSALGRRLELA